MAGGPAFDADLYKQRNVVERCFNRLKRFRDLATHLGKLPIIEGTVIRLEVGRLPSGAIPKPVWL